MRKLDAVLTQVIAIIVVALLVAGGLALWAILQSASGPVVAGVSVMGFGGTLLAANQGLALWSRTKKPEPSLPTTEGEEAAPSVAGAERATRLDTAHSKPAVFDPYTISNLLATE